MKKLVLMSALVLLLLVLTLGNALAMDMEDPVLCVAGQWLAVRDATPASVTVILPADTPYGLQGGCTDPQPVGQLVTNAVVRQGKSPVMHVEVSGDEASPIVTATYGDISFSKPNNLKRMLVFQFNLR